ncbi:hypothetical protein BDZ90DRAFT_234629 [Jaminaea rosea]|uniref:Uncharacterized protein n=1 Tax=Jaminaea rosea TaxID=1569628 RepID=A0A316UJB9_9BASI|nr:hypothetical protein BDZ90DRAFT_234629 [Jaminaea rosea]PWN25024.1 hypothetical protein BDZ90DRAFT_234629 [Jaminaea rosea]
MPSSPSTGKRPLSNVAAANKAASSSKLVTPPPAEDADDSMYSDSGSGSDSDEDDEAANLEMDGQDLWTQNYCSVCDCLIEPGQGVGPRREGDDEPPKTSPSASSAATPTAPQSPPLMRSKAGTIKGRPAKRNGSSARLNALSDLKPTTKITGQKDATSATSAKMSRRSSNTSTASSTQSTGSESPNKLQRTKKGGLLGSLTPAALRQQQEELLKANAPPALYCSERCRTIDEQQQRQLSARGAQELDLYTSQAGTLPGVYASDAPARPWPRTPSMTSLPAATAAAYLAAANNRTPESDYGGPCMCADCMDKTSASGTVPSGASDTTESSGGYPYTRRATGKQRSQSGRLLTPRDLYPRDEGGDQDGYFPRVSRSKARTFSLESGERAASAVSEESSTHSSGSYASLWEPRIRRANKEQQHQSEPDTLRLLRRASPSVDVVTSSPGGTKLAFGTSMTSERTLGTSANTLVHPDQQQERAGHRKARSLAVMTGEQQQQQREAAGVDTLTAERLSKSYASDAGIDAMATLRAARDSRGGGEDSRRHSTASTSGWLRSLSSAWTTLRSASSTTSVPQLLLPGGEADQSRSDLNSPSVSSAITSASSRGSRSPRSPRSPRSEDGSNALSRSAASESLSRVLSSTHLASPVARPGASRGHVPAFASEIGRGEIPGDAGGGDAGGDAGEEAGEHEELQRCRRRRKAEHRHQRSKDVTVLPPLLAPSNRSSTALSAQHRANSYANLTTSRNRSQSGSRGANSRGANFTVGSAGSYRDTHQHATPPTPTSATGVGGGDESMRSPLPRTASQQDVVYRPSMSPRRSGGLLGAMTPITAAPAPRHHHVHHAHRPHAAPRTSASGHRLSTGSSGGGGGGGHALGHVGMLGHHPHGSNPAYGRHNTMPVRTSTPIVPEHGGEMSAEALTAVVPDPLVRPQSAMSQRHLRASYIARPRSSAAHRPVIEARQPHVVESPAPPHRGWSYDNLAGAGAGAANASNAKTYHVLQVPHRRETHDRYDDAYGQGGAMLELIGGKELADSAAEAQRQRRESDAGAAPGEGGGSGRRKQLFHFGA